MTKQIIQNSKNKNSLKYRQGMSYVYRRSIHCGVSNNSVKQKYAYRLYLVQTVGLWAFIISWWKSFYSLYTHTFHYRHNKSSHEFTQIVYSGMGCSVNLSVNRRQFYKQFMCNMFYPKLQTLSVQFLLFFMYSR